jgi:hypothetical protein
VRRGAFALVAVAALALSGCKCGPSCTPVSCTGCCDEMDTCQSGSAPTACGTFGRACTACGTGMGCADGTCKACSASTCTGCCDPSGGCVTGDTKAACGTAGNACTACTTTQTCTSNACVTDPDVCTPGAATVTTATVQASILTSKCGTCHMTGGAGDGYGDFTTASNTQLVVGKKSIYAGGLAQLKIVDPTVLANSSLWLKVSATGTVGRKGPHMEATGSAEPQGGAAKLSPAELTQLQNWICTGATP